MLPNIHILGIQGSGKGTQSALLVEAFGLQYISSGNLFRQRSQENDELGELLKQELKVGHLLSNKLLFNTVEDFLNNTPLRVGLLGDGVIRTTEQHEGLLPIWQAHRLDLPLLVNLVLAEGIALERIEHRKKEIEGAEKMEYHRTYSGKLLYRSDDNPQAIQERFKLFHRMTEPVISIFKQQNRCITLDASQSVTSIHQQLRAQLTEFYPTLNHVSD